MTERINGQGFRPLDTSGARRAESTKAGAGQGARAGDPSAPQPGDTVNITRSALLLGKLAEIVQSTPAVDAERVSAIKTAIASGSYHVDDQSVADNMIRFDRELLG